MRVCRLKGMEKKKNIRRWWRNVVSVNAFRALGRIILHRSVRVTRRRYFAHNTVHIACFSIIRCFIGQLYGLRISLHRLLCTYIVYRMDGVPLSLELDKFSSPLLEKKVRIESSSRQVVCSKKLCWKQLSSSCFHPFEPFAHRIATTSSCFSSHFSSWNASNCKPNVVTS